MTRQRRGSELTPECSLDEHALCPGPQEIRRAGAPSWEAPVVVDRCTCRCHPQTPGRSEEHAAAGKRHPLTL